MKKIFLLLSLMALPAISFAQGQTAEGILAIFQRLLNILIPIGITLAVVWFIYGVIKYMVAADEEAQGNARKAMISGVIGLFVIVSIWGLVSVLNRTFGIDQGRTAGDKLPCVVQDNDPRTPC